MSFFGPSHASPTHGSVLSLSLRHLTVGLSRGYEGNFFVQEAVARFQGRLLHSQCLPLSSCCKQGRGLYCSPLKNLLASDHFPSER